MSAMAIALASYIIRCLMNIDEMKERMSYIMTKDGLSFTSLLAWNSSWMTWDQHIGQMYQESHSLKPY